MNKEEHFILQPVNNRGKELRPKKNPKYGKHKAETSIQK